MSFMETELYLRVSENPPQVHVLKQVHSLHALMPISLPSLSLGLLI